MGNAYIPRETVHAWSEDIGDNAEDHKVALTRLLKEQRRLTRFVEEQAEHLEPTTGGVSIYLMGVIVRMFDLAGGRLKAATWSQVREAAAKVQGAVGELLPVDKGLPERARAISWRAQPHILDEALLALFETEVDEDNEAALSDAESLKVYFLLWVATEVLDQNWKPAKDFQGEGEYTYVHIEPRKPEA